MTSTSPEQQEYEFNDARDGVIERAKSHSVEYEIVRWSSENAPESCELLLKIPNGRDTRIVTVGSDQADVLAHDDFENWCFLGDYNAVLNRNLGSIEAIVSFTANHLNAALSRLLSLPGVKAYRLEKQPSNPTATDETSEGIRVPLRAGARIRRSDSWLIEPDGAGSPVKLQLSPASIALQAVFNSDAFSARSLHVSIKLEKRGVSRHDEALQLLESYSSSLFFEIDTRFDLLLSLVRKRAQTQIYKNVPRAEMDRPISTPKNHYAKEALTLYTYGRSAVGTPLLQYLAYYQSLEFFFPSFHSESILKRVRNALRDPRFNVEDDTKLQRVVALAASSSKGFASEREMLLSTIRGSVEDEQIRDFFNSIDGMGNFMGKGNQINGVPTVVTNSRSSLVEQVSERIYKLRCRIVHSKSDGSSSGQGEVLLPYSSEANKLSYDLALIRFLCQKVIVCGSRGSLW